MTEEPKKINKKIRLQRTVGQAVNSQPSAFTVSILTRKECYMEQIERYLEEIESALYKMSPTEREHLMEVLHLAFADYFENNYRRS